ncbi:siderophore-interacting protein [Rhodococcus artemisiae]|uniref:NADPH-dependent ferric siderophore reductase n=1 Tax=Rhodococcus artemisiae TaxID=714159 RepID=A0ABU7L3C0_9NOCA|nr:hypothetical protein [Rhodococcus artemisiae]MEE2056048.1 hypothetical protein [Rhodococcus artemisiae]
MTDGYELGNGIVMTRAHITDITPRPGSILRFRVHAPLISQMRPRGLAPVFKIFTARSRDARLTLPTFDEHQLALPTWESDPSRPIARAYTALCFVPGADHIIFDALDLGAAASWVHRARIGDTVGVIGFKHEFIVDDTVDSVLLVGDRSTSPAVDEILRSCPDRARTTVLPTDVSFDDGDSWETRMQSALVGAGDHTSVWIAGEVDLVAAGRRIAIASGVPGSRIVSLPYWHRDLSREDFDRVLYRRYQRAAEAGLEISDPEIAAQIELSRAEPTELHAIGSY